MDVSSVTIDPYLEDSSGYQGEAERVLVPSNLKEVVEVVQACSRTRTPLTVAGAGTGLTGARVPHGGWVISLERFRNLEIRRGRAICGPGVILSDLQQAAAQTRQFFGPNPTEISASIGGIVSTNAGGARSFHYGSVRRHVLALEVTFMDGRTHRFQRGERVDFPVPTVPVPATTKNSAGYQLHPDLEWVDLLSGSEGTLGVVTEAELRLLPEPGAILSGVVFFPSDDLALDAVDAWRPVPELRFLEFLDRPALDFLRPRYPEIPQSANAAMLVEQNLASEQDEEIERWSDRLQQQQAFEDESWFGMQASDRERFRAFRHNLSVTVVDTVRRNGFPKFGTDYAVPVSRHRELYDFYKRRCEETLPGQYTIYGHVGDGNNHVNLLPLSQDQADKAASLIHEFAEFVVSLGGTIAAEHGVGKAKVDLLKIMYSPAVIESMKSVKRRLDPDWLLGRGTIFEA